MHNRTGSRSELIGERAALPLIAATLTLAPGTASACTGCTLEFFGELFPFLTPWAMVFLAWSVIFIMWHLASPKGKALSPKAGRICLELVGILLLIVATGYSVLLFYWAYIVGKLWWLSWKKRDPALSPGVRIFSLFFNGITSALLIVSVALGYAGVEVGWKQMRAGSHRIRAYDAAAQADLRNCRTSFDAYFYDHQRYPSTLEEAQCSQSMNKDVVIDVSKTAKDGYALIAFHKKGNLEYMIRSGSADIFFRERNSEKEWEKKY